jgi:hypothetical protein
VLWIGTKDLLVSLLFTAVFVVVFQFLLNEESAYTILPETFTQYYNNLDEIDKNTVITEDDIKNAKKTLKIAQEKQRELYD